MAIPVTLVAKGGMPVVAVAAAAPPMLYIASGGAPITLTDVGPAFVVQGLPSPVNWDWQSISMTAGEEGQWVGYSTGAATTPQPAFGTIDGEPTAETILLAFYEDAASGVFIAVFQGDYYTQLISLGCSIGGYPLDLFDVEVISGNTWARFNGLPGDIEDGEVYQVEFS